MRRRTLRKEYLAVVAGIPRVRKGEVALAIGRDPRDRKRMKAFRVTGDEAPVGTRTARTLYEIERRDERLELVLAASGTGFWEWDVRNGALTWSEAIFIQHGLDPASGPPTSIGSTGCATAAS